MIQDSVIPPDVEYSEADVKEWQVDNKFKTVSYSG